MSVNSIRKHCTDEEVVTLAKLLIKDWKRLLGKSTSGKDHFSISASGGTVCGVDHGARSECLADTQSPTEMKNGVEHPGSPVHSPFDRDTRWVVF